ncbi:hypothetical protein Tco_0954844 [Tanacetum coccineum]|uniref:Uncharacterized protein n=1 Tax=Tanacetum coccineum TaxID=301880 RepID=A0ABQ5E5I2_9ASTR
MGKGSANPTDPHHTSSFIQPTPQPQKTQKPRKPKRKDTQVPQPSGPMENVANEAIHKELGDSLVKAATTASSLEAEQDSFSSLKALLITRRMLPNTSLRYIAFLKLFLDQSKKLKCHLTLIINLKLHITEHLM